MLAPCTGTARTYRQVGRQPRQMPDYAEQTLRYLTDVDGVVDYDARDFKRLGYADGATLGTWPARRGGLDLSTVAGTPAYTAPDADVAVPSVAYAASGERHEGPATLDWSAYDGATLISVHYTESVSGVSRGMSLAAATTDSATGGGLATYRVDGKITGLHRTDEPESSGFWLEREGTVDPALAATVVTHDLAAASSADLIRIWVDGTEEEGSTSGDDTQGDAWQSDLRVRLGAESTSDVNGLDGRLVRFIACPRALTADQALRASQALLYTART